jgi:hypothetical protein
MELHRVQCQCGTLRGQLEGGGISSRIICFCSDCRAFANYLGRPDVLDKQGGTEIVQVAQPRLSFTQGADHLAAVRLKENGLLRWYASCCKTPICNTMADVKGSFAGMIHSSLDPARMDRDFGADIAIVNTETALGDPKPVQRGLFGVIVRFIGILATTLLTGRYKKSALFDEAGSPRVVPTILAPEELARLKSTS